MSCFNHKDQMIPIYLRPTGHAPTTRTKWYQFTWNLQVLLQPQGRNYANLPETYRSCSTQERNYTNLTEAYRSCSNQGRNDTNLPEAYRSCFTQGRNNTNLPEVYRSCFTQGRNDTNLPEVYRSCSNQKDEIIPIYLKPTGTAPTTRTKLYQFTWNLQVLLQPQGLNYTNLPETYRYCSNHKD